MENLPAGLYQSIVTEGLRTRLDALPRSSHPKVRPLHPAETPDRVALHLSREIERGLADIPESDRAAVGVEVARALLARLGDLVDVDPAQSPVTPASILDAILGQLPDGRPREINTPITPLLDTTVLTNAPGEPNLWKQLRSEIESCESIDVVMAFIRRSGINPLLDALATHADQGRRIRILTTIYTGSTEGRALDVLRDLGAEIRVSYDISTTRLHAKAWTFHRYAGLGTAYIGSSNLTHSAQVTGLEWNVRVSEARNADVVSKVAAVFESYWECGDFVPYEASEFEREMARTRSRESGPTLILSPAEIRPLPFQERLLELLQVSRQHGYHRNLLVAATGTGKTVMAALDYARLRQQLTRARLLFVAHREEILDQSRATFAHALRDPSFGEKWVGGSKPDAFEHVFASVQSLSSTGIDALDPTHFDIVIVDEFHHAAAKSYERILQHLDPVELLGLTATPERTDGLPVLQWFDDRIAAELRLWDAIDQQYLTPFVYFGVHDGTDLTNIPWRRGRGYDTTALSGAYTSSDAWARLVMQQVDQHVDTTTMRCLGFCVDVRHAQFMAAQFSSHGLPAVAIWGDTPWTEREAALRDLRDRKISAVFSVDLFNEGVDVPTVDTILMLRPTESPVLFLQQLGRGLRKAPDKPVCTVLDFVGSHRTEFRFDRRFRALLGGTRRSVEDAVVRGFPYLPSGCSMQLDKVSSEIVLRSIREAIPSRWPSKVAELRSMRDAGVAIDLRTYLEETGLELADVYTGNKGWSDLMDAAGVSTLTAGPHESGLRRAVGRSLHIDDEVRIEGYQALLASPIPPQAHSMAERERRVLRMLLAPMLDQVLKKDMTLQDAADILWAHPQVRAELREVLGTLATQIDHLHAPLTTHPDSPLQVHGRYSRLEILAGMGVGGDSPKIASWQSGVLNAKEAGADLLAFTLDKSAGTFSPKTRYRDYAISRSLIHWESQSSTRADSDTGRRYRNHEAMDRSILLFARMTTLDRSFWFLGPAQYVSGTGERPMAITWELAHPLPGDLYAEFAAAVA